MKNLLIILLLPAMLSSCYTQKKAAKQTEKARKHYPAMVAGKCADWYPSVESETIVSNTDTVYDLIELPCDSFETVRVDSFETSTAVIRYVKVPTMRITTRIETVITKVDSARLLVVRAQAAKLQAQLKEEEVKSANRGTWAMWLAIALLLSLFVNYAQFKRK